MIRIAVLASGGGSNLGALLAACEGGAVRGRIVAVLSDVPGAGALDRARAAGVPAVAVPRRGHATRADHEAALLAALAPHDPDLVCLAGYMRLLSPAFLRALAPRDPPVDRGVCLAPGLPRVMNIHPALLPSFPGLHAQAQALACGARFSGCTVHFVDEGTDSGPVILQAVVPVDEADTVETLSARILGLEHRIYPQAVAWYAAGRLSLDGRKVRVAGARAWAGHATSPAEP